MDDLDRRADAPGPPVAHRDDGDHGPSAALRPRARIAMLMAVVGLAALDFAAIRAHRDLWASASTGDRTLRIADELLVGALPMANLLVIGLLVGGRGLGKRPFLLGFEASGAAALSFYIGAACLSPESVLIYLALVLLPVGWSGRRPWIASGPMFHGLIAGIILIHHLSFSVAGGILGRMIAPEGQRDRPRGRPGSIGPEPPPLRNRES